MLLALAMTVSILSSMGCAADAAPELGPVTSKDVVYQIITDRFYDGDTAFMTETQATIPRMDSIPPCMMGQVPI